MKTSELEGEMLNRAVAKCEGIKGFDAENCCFYDDEGMPFEPSCVWAQGGPIIERECIAISCIHITGWTPDTWTARHPQRFNAEGPTPLIAAMRCYVASKLGDEVEIPEELK